MEKPDNICYFVKTQKADEEINILHFVYERRANFPNRFTINSIYSICLVTAGKGVLYTPQHMFDLKAGDLFFLISAKPYRIENTDGLEYIYISFTGIRASALLQNAGVGNNSLVYDGNKYISSHWQEEFSRANPQNTALICEGLLLFTLSHICDQNNYEKIPKEKSSIVLQMKEYIDLNYTDPTLNLKTLCEKFSYSPKYISAAFLKTVKVPFTNYLRDLRLDHAKKLLLQGFVNMGEVAFASGFSDAFYFSKTFKMKFGISPKSYYCQQQNANEDTPR